jgi:hypothetical protein
MITEICAADIEINTVYGSLYYSCNSEDKYIGGNLTLGKLYCCLNYCLAIIDSFVLHCQ